LEIFEQKIVGYAKIILPMATPKPYTYHITEDVAEKVKFGVRVEVQFGVGRDLYSAIVMELTDVKPEHPTKPIMKQL
jgi:primosomal protein N' (replication factor Y) (superfamily II helicase)